MRVSARLFSLTAVCLMIVGTAFARPQSFKPKNGFVPDEKTATAVGRAILSAIYGEKEIAREEPLSASLRGGTWYVKGALPANVAEGGVAEVEISKQTGAVLRVTHGK